MKLRQPWMIRLLAFLAAVVLRFWTGTIRYRMILRDPRVYPGEPTFEGRYIYSLWHETLIGVAGRSWPAKIYMLVSQHADGELIARVAQHMGFGIVRGSSTRGGATALRELVDLGSRALLAVTPDGPRGPRRQLQPGMVFLASHTGLPIIPVGVAYRHCWRARSWDRLAIPWPFTAATIILDHAVAVPPDLDREGLETYRVMIEARMNDLTAQAEKMTW